MREINCILCGISFQATGSSSKFCALTCKAVWVARKRRAERAANPEFYRQQKRDLYARKKVADPDYAKKVAASRIEYARIYKKENKQKIAAYHMKYAVLHRERRNENQRILRAENIEKYKQMAQKRYQKNQAILIAVRELGIKI